MAMEAKYEDAVYRCTSKGLVARFGEDTLPTATFQNLLNLEVRQENALSLRFGHIPLTVSGGNSAPLGGLVLQLGRLKGLGGSTWRYAQAGGNLYRIAGDYPGAWSNIQSGLSTTIRDSMVPYTPIFSSTPYLFIADANLMLKDNGSGSPSPWGLLWPAYPITSVVNDTLYGFYYILGSYTVTGGSSSALVPYSQYGTIQTIGLDSLITLKMATVSGIQVGQKANIFAAGVGYIVLTIQQLDATNNLLFIDNLGDSFKIEGANTSVTVDALRINTVASAGGTVTVVPVTPNPSQNWNPLTDGSQVPTVAVRVEVADPTQLASIEIDVSTGDATFANYFSYAIPASQLTAASLSVIKVPESVFTANGVPDWTKVFSIRVIITSAAGSPTSTTADLYSVTLDLGAQETILGGVDYDWRMTFYDANTGGESNPSSEQLAGSIYNPLGMFLLPVLLSWPTSGIPAGATHRRIYRRGGTLATGWHMIAQVPLSVLQIYDVVSDQVASDGDLLSIDNFPPITSTLPSPVNTTLVAPISPITLFPSNAYPLSMQSISLNQLLTIGQGATEEIVTVTGVFSDHFTAYFEFSHSVGESVYGEAAYAQACSGAAFAFQRMWLWGDPNNPGRLYYSNVDSPEDFGVEGYLDLGNLTDPIMGAVYESGVLIVRTLSTAWFVYALNGSQPSQQQTDSNHGLFSWLAIIKGEGSSYFYSDDGIYAWSGGRAVEVSQFLQWIFREYTESTQSPVPVMDLNQRNAANFGYYQNEIFFSYKTLPGALESISITPSNTTIIVGGEQQYTAMGTYADGTVEDITNSVVWSSTDGTVATIENGGLTPGLATGVGAGLVTINATLDSIVGSTGLTVIVYTGAFTLSALPNSVTINQSGGQAQSVVTAVVSGGFDNAISFSPSFGAMVGLSVSISPGVTDPPGNGSVTVTITISAGSSIPVASYPITINGNGGGSAGSTVITLNVVASGGVSYSPTTFSDIGDVPTVDPTFAYDNNLATFAKLEGIFTYVHGEGGRDIGMCQWFGFSAVVLSAPLTLYISIGSLLAGTNTGYATVGYTSNLQSVFTQIVKYTSTHGQTTVSITLPAGTNLSSIVVTAEAYCENGGTSTESGTVTCRIYEIWVAP